MQRIFDRPSQEAELKSPSTRIIIEMNMPKMPVRPDTTMHHLLGLTPPSEQKSWRDDDDWLEFSKCDHFDDHASYQVVGGGEIIGGHPFPEVLVSAFDVGCGEHTELKMPADTARALAKLLLKRADEADAEVTKPASRVRSVDYLMEELRAAYHRKEARRR